MNKLTKLTVFGLTLTACYRTLTTAAYAVCPVCTIAVGAGLGLSRWFGIDDAVSGVWFGGLTASLSFWTVNWLGSKNIKHKYLLPIVFAAWFSATVVPLWYAGVIGHPFNTILGIDKLLFGMAAGAAAFLAGFWADKKVRDIKGRQLFDFQKVAFPLSALAIVSLILFIITSVNITFL